MAWLFVMYIHDENGFTATIYLHYMLMVDIFTAFI
ncbi:hypothetical protein Xhom_00060 [Xenorhabdus hominickii]|uniref:Uncharacterized protein n=1 Tax=Xenorhabdus hominickii TaxID=351679 RepID=A0A2G0QD23_XENHO|nr:hypothetical protein Xhom_02275 [Xenorhabdus hominickii]PHM57106.1 hypothetical protein Xhom_00060 [Xenorhabdus hominickii]